MKKLLVISTNSIHVYNYINLVRSHFDEILLITDAENDKLDYGDLNIEYTEFSIKKPLAFFKSIGFIKRKIEEFNPSVIHSHQISTNSYLALLANKKLGKPLLFTAWGSDVLYTPQKGWLYHKMVKIILRKGRYFTSDSLFLAGEMERLAEKELDVTIANFGINLSDVEKVEKQNIIYSNRQLKPLYRIDKIIYAFKKFIDSQDDKSWALVVGATGEEKERLEMLAKELGVAEKIDFVGWLSKEENTHYYNIARYFISVPESDGTSISLLEAMYLGCIPILSNLPANTEWVIDGLNGVIVSSLNDNFISSALDINSENAVSINRELIVGKGTKEVNMRKFIQLYNRILGENVEKN